MSDTMRLTLQLTAVDLLSGILSSARQHIQSLGDAGKKVQRDFDEMTSHITKGLKAIAVASYATHEAMKGIKIAGDLQEAMGDVRMDIMRSGQSAADLNTKLAQVRSTAVSIQAVTPFSSQDVVRVEDTLLRAGLHMKDIVGKGGAAWAASALATVTHNNPEEMAKALVHTAVPFHISGEGYGALADQLQRVATAGGTDLPDLMEGMKYVSGQAAAMKVSLQDVVTTMGVLSKSGLEGGVAGESFNHFLVMLNGVTPQSVKYMKHLGISAYDAQGHIRPMTDLIKQLRVAFSRLTDEQRQNAELKLFGLRGERVANALLNEGDYSFEGITAHMKEQGSLTEKMIERMKDYNANVQALKTTWQSTIATMFDPFLEPLTKALGRLNEMASTLGEMGEKSKGLTAAFALLLGGGIIGLTGFGLTSLARGGIAGSRALRGLGGISGFLRGFGGTAAGVAEGKALEKTAGVTPVFVTNWPGSIGAGNAVTEAAEAAGAGGVLKTAAGGGGLAGVAGLAGTAAVVAGLGVAIGEGINYLVFDSPYAKKKNTEQLEFEKTHKWDMEHQKYIETGPYSRPKPEEGLSLKSLMAWFDRNVTAVQKPEIKNNVPINLYVSSDKISAETRDLKTNVQINSMKRGKI